jgi:L-threonylcarbamoyladenylate synthase
MSEVIPLDDVGAVRARAGAVLRGGGLVVLPTDTVYAVVVDAFRPDATSRLWAAKGRDRRTPLAVLVRSPRQISGFVEGVPDPAERLMAAYWPGPLTIVLTAVDGMTWDLGDTAGTVSVRMPADEVTVEVVGDVGPLACSGANVAGAAPSTTVKAAREQLGDAVALYVDGGIRDAASSSVVDCRGEAVEVLREGAIPTAHVLAVANGEVPWGQRPAVER